MGMFVSMVGALSTFYPDAKKVHDPQSRQLQVYRLIAKVPTLAAFAYRHTIGMRFNYPDNDLSYAGNFLKMMFCMSNSYTPDPVLEKALDQLFILHADHEQNCSTTAMRVIGSSEADPFVALSGSMAALYGPLHGGANEAVLRMLDRIGKVENIPAFLEKVKNKEEKLMGFGHRVYKAYDPRASIVKRTADEVFEVTGRNHLLDIALELERVALNEQYFIDRNLYPNVDFYSGMIYQAIGLSVKMMTVLFAVGRSCGWLAQWKEMLNDAEQKIARPRQVYTGADERNYVAMDQR